MKGGEIKRILGFREEDGCWVRGRKDCHMMRDKPISVRQFSFCCRLPLVVSQLSIFLYVNKVFRVTVWSSRRGGVYSDLKNKWLKTQAMRFERQAGDLVQKLYNCFKQKSEEWPIYVQNCCQVLRTLSAAWCVQHSGAKSKGILYKKKIIL